MITALIIIGGVLFVSFFMIVFRGAPYVPTRAGDIDTIFREYDFTDKDTMVDLGSGDGRLLVSAGQRKINAIGYELNPFLYLVSLRRAIKYRRYVSVRMVDFWITDLPPSTTVVFVFLASPYMKKLDRHLSQQVERLPHGLTLISYGMSVPGRTPEKTAGPLFIYTYSKS